MARLLGIDIGTSGCKVVMIDDTGAVLAQASASYPVSMPQPTWSEQNPNDWWAGVHTCLSAILPGYAEPAERSPHASPSVGLRPQPSAFSSLSGLGLTGQMHGAVFLDENDQVIRPAILWNDQRTVAECEEIERMVGEERVRAITCNPPLTGFQLPKLLWLRKHEPENYARVRTVLLPKDYIRFRLTGMKATDVSDASGTGIFDVPNRIWSGEIADKLGVDLSVFPACFESYEDAPGGDPVFAADAGDQAAGAVGTGAVRKGVVSVSLGTSGVVFAALDQPNYDPSGALHTFCHANGKWHAMGVMLSCGGALNWFASAFRPGASFDDITKEAESAEPGCSGLSFLPYLSGERSPHNDPSARGSWSGLTLSHGPADLSRSVLEGVTFGLLDSLEALKRLGVECNEIRLTGGGAKSAFWCQLIADVFQTPVHTLAVDEGPAFGAALLAGVASGVFNSVEDACARTVKLRRQFSPTGVDYSAAYKRFRDLYPALRAWK